MANFIVGIDSIENDIFHQVNRIELSCPWKKVSCDYLGIKA